MKLKCIITKITKHDKEILYTFDFNILDKVTNPENNKNIIPTIIDKTLDAVLETNIPERLEEHLEKGNCDMRFSVTGEGVNVEFDLHDKRYKN
jgi:hypothetical protein